MTRVVSLVAVGAIVLAGCSPSGDISEAGQSVSPTPSPESTSAPSVSPMSSPEVWEQSIAATTGLVDVDAQLITNVEGFERIVFGQGVVDLDAGFGDISWTDELASTREVKDRGGHYLELDGTWFALDDDSAVPTKVGFIPLAGLSTASNVTATGSEDVLGPPATRFDADLDADLGPSIMGFSGEELTVVNEATSPLLTSTIWVNDEGRIIRVLREYRAWSPDGDAISATTLFLLGAPTQEFPVNIPETADAIPAPA